MVVVKCCSGCGVVKSLDDYHRNRARRDGHHARCKECVKETSCRHYEENRDKVLEYSRRHREENLDKVRECKRRYREENRDKISERDRRYYEENLEYVNRRNSRYNNRRQSVTESSSTKRGPWSEAEIAILMADDGRTIVAKALELGRTYASCDSKRRNLRRAGATN